MLSGDKGAGWNDITGESERLLLPFVEERLKDGERVGRRERCLGIRCSSCCRLMSCALVAVSRLVPRAIYMDCIIQLRGRYWFVNKVFSFLSLGRVDMNHFDNRPVREKT